MVGRRKIGQIKVANYGMNKVFRLKDYDRSTVAGYAVTITIWHVVDEVITKIVDEVACTAVVSGSDTLVTYVPASAAVFTAAGDYEGEITFIKVGTYDEDCGTFAWRVIPSAT